MSHFRVWNNGDWETISPVGRVEWALKELIAAGWKGIDPIDYPGVRWSHYVKMLRRKDLCIETITAPHWGPFSGRHARHILYSKVEPWEDRDAA